MKGYELRVFFDKGGWAAMLQKPVHIWEPPIMSTWAPTREEALSDLDSLVKERVVAGDWSW